MPSCDSTALAAVMFACMDNKPVQTEYFSRMSLSGFKGEHYGHTGQGFSYLWTMLGANVGGPLAVAEYQKKMRWDRDMKRRYDGSFVYEGGEQWGPGQASNYWDDSYTYWGYPTAYYLLQAAIPLKITRLYEEGAFVPDQKPLFTYTGSFAALAEPRTGELGARNDDAVVPHDRAAQAMVRP